MEKHISYTFKVHFLFRMLLVHSLISFSLYFLIKCISVLINQHVDMCNHCVCCLSLSASLFVYGMTYDNLSQPSKSQRCLSVCVCVRVYLALLITSPLPYQSIMFMNCLYGHNDCMEPMGTHTDTQILHPAGQHASTWRPQRV